MLTIVPNGLKYLSILLSSAEKVRCIHHIMHFYSSSETFKLSIFLLCTIKIGNPVRSILTFNWTKALKLQWNVGCNMWCRRRDTINIFHHKNHHTLHILLLCFESIGPLGNSSLVPPCCGCPTRTWAQCWGAGWPPAWPRTWVGRRPRTSGRLAPPPPGGGARVAARRGGTSRCENSWHTTHAEKRRKREDHSRP